MTTCFSEKTKWAAAWQNQQNDLCAQQRRRSAWTSALSDQSRRCPHEESLGPWLSLECNRSLWSDWADAQADLSLCWTHRSFCWFCHMQAYMGGDDSLCTWVLMSLPWTGVKTVTGHVFTSGFTPHVRWWSLVLRFSDLYWSGESKWSWIFTGIWFNWEVSQLKCHLTMRA